MYTSILLRKNKPAMGTMGEDQPWWQALQWGIGTPNYNNEVL